MRSFRVCNHPNCYIHSQRLHNVRPPVCIKSDSHTWIEFKPNIEYDTLTEEYFRCAGCNDTKILEFDFSLSTPKNQ